MIRLKINLNKVQIKEWCMRNKYSVITTGEILKKRFGLKSTKEIISKINFPGNPDYFDDTILKGNLNQQLIYKDEDEEKELEDIICSIFGCLFYLGDNKISKTKIKSPSPYKKDDIILSKEEYITLYNFTYKIFKMKIIDGEIIFDHYNIYSNIKSPWDFYAEHVVEREITKFAYGK